LLQAAVVRGLQWWQSSTLSIGDPDAVVWTDRRTVRRARALRAAKVALAVAIAALLGTAVGLHVRGTRAADGATVHGKVG
jgi:hypothetical protein